MVVEIIKVGRGFIEIGSWLPKANSDFEAVIKIKLLLSLGLF